MMDEPFESAKLDKKFLVVFRGIETQLTRIADSGQSGGNTEIMNKLQEIQVQMANDRTEVLAKLSNLNTEVVKVGADLAAFVDQLRADIAAGNDLTDVVASIDDVATRLQGVDDTIPERPVV